MPQQLRLSLKLIAVITLSASICSACSANCVRFTAKHDTSAKVYLPSARPVVFEIGKLGIPWRQILDVRDVGHVLTWQVRKGRVYEVWDAQDYAREQLAEAKRSTGCPSGKHSTLTDQLLHALKWLEDRRQPDAQLIRARLIYALSALLGIKIDIRAGAEGYLWPDYPLPVTVSFACAASGVRVRITKPTIPDNWQIVSRPSVSRFHQVSRVPVKSTFMVKVPAIAMRYEGLYPIIAWCDVEYRGQKFRVSNATEVSIGDAFEREAWIDTVSDTRIDLHIRLTSRLPIKGVTTEPYLPDGWTCIYPREPFDVCNSRELVYRITRPKSEKRGLRIVGGIFSFGSFSTSKRLITDHALELAETTGVTGFKLIRVKGDEARQATILGTACRQVPPSGRMLFDVSPNFSPGSETYLTLKCATLNPATLSVEYRTTSGRIVSTKPQVVHPANGPHELTFVLKSASFDGKLPHGADFVVCSSDKSLGIAGIYISRFRTL